MQLHRNPNINSILQKYLGEDGVVRIPKEVVSQLWDISSEDPDYWNSSEPHLVNQASETKFEENSSRKEEQL